MKEAFIFNFKKDISGFHLPQKLNNPFGTKLPKITILASEEFQSYLESRLSSEDKEMLQSKGKMFGTLVIRKTDGSLAYLGTHSGMLSRDNNYDQFVPSIFDDASDDYFINKGMTELSEISGQIKRTKNPLQVQSLKEQRKSKSLLLQKQLFENYHFQNIKGQERNVLQIFSDGNFGNPPSATGECVAPKLLQFALKHHLEPIAISEFWWGASTKSQLKKHKSFYPACHEKCRPLLQYMLDDPNLFEKSLVD